MKLYQMVNDQSTNRIIGWVHQGHGFQIFDNDAFSSRILPKYFKHNKLSSFIRQLNMYDFKKLPGKKDHYTFQNP